MAQDINLYKVNSGLSPSELVMVYRLKIFSIFAAALCVGLALILSVVYYASQSQYNQLEEQRTILVRSLNSEARKQLLLANIRSRIPILGSIFKIQRPWDQIAEVLFQLAAPPFLQSFVIDELNHISIKAKSGSIDEVNQLVINALNLEREKKIQKSVIDSLQIDKTGLITISFSYIVPNL